MTMLQTPETGIEVELHPLVAQRLDLVMAVEQRAHPHPWSVINFLDSLEAGYQGQMLMADGHLLGYLVAMRGVEEVHLLNITVAPEYQRQGWSRVLLESLTIWARGQAAQWIWLEVRVSNARARHVYETHGFRRVGTRRDYYRAANGQREDAVVMGLHLNPESAP